jgi:hypothetical protein
MGGVIAVEAQDTETGGESLSFEPEIHGRPSCPAVVLPRQGSPVIPPASADVIDREEYEPGDPAASALRFSAGVVGKNEILQAQPRRFGAFPTLLGIFEVATARLLGCGKGGHTQW